MDAGNYNQVFVRKASRKLKIQNETVLRYDKFLHPYLTEIALKRATKLILDLAGGEFYENEDWYPTKWEPKIINLTFNRVKQLSGMDIETTKIKTILNSLEYKTISENEQGIELEIPYFRTDVEVEDDIVADILRINDYANIPVTHLQAAPPKEITPEIYKFEEKLKKMFDKIQEPFEKHCPKDRINFLSYSYVLHKFFQLLELDDYVRCFPLLKSRTKLRIQDEIWKKICEELDWEFIPTI